MNGQLDSEQPYLGDLLTMVINRLAHETILQVHTQKTDMGSIHVQKDVVLLTEEVPLTTCQTA